MGAGDLLAEDDDEEKEDQWSEAYLPGALEQAGPASLPGSSDLVSFLRPSGPEALPSWNAGFSPTGSPEAHFTASTKFQGHQHFKALYIRSQALKEENAMLQRKMMAIQSFSETQIEMMRTLEARLLKEEHHYLEAVVQKAEQKLELMEKRARKAEKQVQRLKQEKCLLQEQVAHLKLENQALLEVEVTNLAVVRHNTDMALRSLHLVLDKAHSSIKQLISGAERLNLVAEILKSIDKISEMKEKEEEDEEEG